MTDSFVCGIWHEGKKRHSTEWLPYTEWIEKKKSGTAWWSHRYHYAEPNYREVQKNEMILEDDSLPPQKQREVHKFYCNTLEKAGVSGELWETGGKGLHIQTLWNVELNSELITELVKQLFPIIYDSFDPSNWRINGKGEKGTGRMLGRENQPHRKTGKPKTLILSFGKNKVNEFPKKIFKEITEKKKKRTEFFKNFKQPKFYGKCLVCAALMSKPFPPSSDVHRQIVPNFVLIFPDEGDWQTAADTQVKNFSEFNGWNNNNNKVGRTFSCKQVQKYANKNGLNDICEFCPHKKIRITQEVWKYKKKMKGGWR